ncbi:MAG: outer membrane protein transport protein [Polyangiaceae bacterium]|nr:outer membrane protein transport protein [Polyangiaceae bacterium]
MKRSRAWSGALAAAAAGLLSGASQAGTEDSYGLGPTDMALGGSVAARPGTAAATYWNPAGLSPGGDTPPDPAGFGELSLAFVHAHPLVWASRADGSSVPLAVEPPDTRQVVLGSRFDLLGRWGVPGLHVGLVFEVPATDIFRWSIHPDEAVQWLFLSDRSQHVGIHVAAGYRIVPWLSLGLGLTTLFDVETNTTGTVTKVTSVVDPETGASSLDVEALLGEQVRVFGRFAPNAGVLVTPVEELRIGATYRARTYVDDWGSTRIQGAPVAGDLGYVHHYAHYFRPHELTLALAARPHPSVWLSADVTYARWSEGLTTSHAALGPGRFGDTFSPAVGVSWRPAAAIELQAGYKYAPSPFDNFGGPTNLLDASSHVASFGGRVDLPPAYDTRAWVGWAFRTTFYQARAEEKDPRRFASDLAVLTNPGYPGYRYGGAVPAASLEVGVQW